VTDAEVVPGPGNDRQPVILLVEDEVLIRLSTAELLRERGYQVLEAADAAEAIALLRSGHPLDLVISDVRMPGPMDGLGLTSALKEARPNLPVALFSGHLAGDFAHGGDGFLRKPCEPDEIIALVERLIGGEWQNSNNPNASSS
jgi:CheY-like chemotaxis protein